MRSFTLPSTVQHYACPQMGHCLAQGVAWEEVRFGSRRYILRSHRPRAKAAISGTRGMQIRRIPSIFQSLATTQVYQAIAIAPSETPRAPTSWQISTTRRTRGLSSNSFVCFTACRKRIKKAPTAATKSAISAPTVCSRALPNRSISPTFRNADRGKHGVV